MRLRHALRIARWEVVSGAGGLDRRALVAAALTLAALGILGPVVATAGTPQDAGIYRVGVAPDSPYYEPVADDVRFAVAAPDRAAFERGRQDLLIRGRSVRVPDTPVGRAAASALAEAVERYNDRLMRAEPDRAAAFPVTVELEYVERNVGLVRERRGENGGSSGDGGGDSSGGDSDSSGGGGSSDDGGNDGGGGDDGDAGGDTSGTDTGGGGGGGLPSLGGSEALLGQTTGSPSEISPPFPFASLVLAFAFVVPMNFVIQVYASSVLHERTNRRGEALLVAPVGRWSIIAGKTLPYFLAMVAIAGATAALIGGGPLSLLAVLPIALLFLGSSFLGALLARSHKELTFVLVTVSVVVTTYVFVPAIFTDVHPVAAISPLTVVVRDLEGVRIAAESLLFSTMPVTVAAGALFALGAGMYREEDLFAQRPLPAKLLDALANPVSRPRDAALLSVLSIPFVLLAELLAVALLFVLPVAVSLPLLLVAIATVEEVAKSVHVYAGFRRGRYSRALPAAAVVGAASGAGFFLGEKAAIAVQLVGLTDLDLGRAAFELGAGIGGASSPATLAVLALAPLALHIVTAGLTAIGASRDRLWYGVALALAVLVHVLYNLGVVVGLG